MDENARLAPLADAGRQYREDLVADALAEGVRAMGEAFPTETYRGIMNRAGLEEIKQLRANFAAQAAVRLPGGRQTKDSSEQPAQQAKHERVPASHYKA